MIFQYVLLGISIFLAVALVARVLGHARLKREKDRYSKVKTAYIAAAEDATCNELGVSIGASALQPLTLLICKKKQTPAPNKEA